MPSARRSSTFAVSDIRSASEEFIRAIAEHAETIWEPDLEDVLADSLADRAFEVLRDPERNFR